MMRQSLVLLLAAGFFGVSACGQEASTSPSASARASYQMPSEDLGRDRGEDVYDDAVPTFAGVDDTPTPTSPGTPSVAGTDDPAADFLKEQSQNLSCEGVAEVAMEYSAFAAKETGQASIVKVFSTELTGDWTEGLALPPEGEKSPVIRCEARVRWSADYDSDVDLWFLVDSNGDLRIRWDNVRNIKRLGSE